MAGSMKSSAVPYKHCGASNSGNGYPVEQMRRRFEHLYHDAAKAQSIMLKHRYYGPEPHWSTDGVRAQRPAVDIMENAEAYVISVELPGIDKQKLSVKIVNGTLLIRAEKSDDENDDAIICHLAERQFGRFERHFALPESADTAHIEATFKTGVLKLRVPKQAAATKASEIMVTARTGALSLTPGHKSSSVLE